MWMILKKPFSVCPCSVYLGLLYHLRNGGWSRVEHRMDFCEMSIPCTAVSTIYRRGLSHALPWVFLQIDKYMVNVQHLVSESLATNLSIADCEQFYEVLGCSSLLFFDLCWQRTLTGLRYVRDDDLRHHTVRMYVHFFNPFAWILITGPQCC